MSKAAPTTQYSHPHLAGAAAAKTKGRAGLAAVTGSAPLAVAAGRAVELTAISLLTGLLTTGLALPARALTMLQPSSVSTNAGSGFGSES